MNDESTDSPRRRVDWDSRDAAKVAGIPERFTILVGNCGSLPQNRYVRGLYAAISVILKH